MVNINVRFTITFQPESGSGIHHMPRNASCLRRSDLYRYTGSDRPCGPMDLMANGFVHMGAYMKRKYSRINGLAKSTISEPGEYLLIRTSVKQRISCSPNSSSQYFVLEQLEKDRLYEGNIPGSGLIVYRINTLQGR